MAQLQKALDRASQALAVVAQHSSGGAKLAYGDLTKTLRAVARDAGKANRALVKELEKLSAPGAAKRAAPRRTRSTGLAARRPRRHAARSALPGDPGGNPPPD